jgi:hypothetical protein
MLDKKYKKYLEGKSVAIIGPAEYLTKLETGRYIDSFDIVVRINRGTEVIEKYSNSIGTRTDILYNCLIKSPDNGGDIKIKEYLKSGVKWISTIPSSDINGICKSNKLHNMVGWFTVFKLKRNFNFHIMDYRKYSVVNEHVLSRANTGFAAIYDLLNHGVSKLYITGYSFYLDNFISGYKDGCERDEEEFAKQCFASKRHKQEPQWKCLKEIVKKDDRIEVDAILQKILNMEDLSRDIKFI